MRGVIPWAQSGGYWVPAPALAHHDRLIRSTPTAGPPHWLSQSGKSRRRGPMPIHARCGRPGRSLRSRRVHFGQRGERAGVCRGRGDVTEQTGLALQHLARMRDRRHLWDIHARPCAHEPGIGPHSPGRRPSRSATYEAPTRWGTRYGRRRWRSGWGEGGILHGLAQHRDDVRLGRPGHLLAISREPLALLREPAAFPDELPQQPDGAQERCAVEERSRAPPRSGPPRLQVRPSPRTTTACLPPHPAGTGR